MGLCERCKKAQATFHLTNIQPDGEKAEQHLCDQCAAAEGLLHHPKPSVNVGDVLESFISTAAEKSADVAGLVCPECGTSYVEFRNQSLLGCPQDYDAFGEAIAQVILRAQDQATHHTGKTPKTLETGAVKTKEPDLRKLRRQMEEAVAAEDYERAAELRDRIQKMEEA